MSTVQEIEAAIEKLKEHAVGQLAQWFEEYRAEKWEQRFATDVPAGKLDKLGEAATARLTGPVPPGRRLRSRGKF